MTQYTYFQQAAGLPLPAPSVEITYGLERIMTALQVRSPSAQGRKMICPAVLLRICSNRACIIFLQGSVLPALSPVTLFNHDGLLCVLARLIKSSLTTGRQAL